MNAFFTAPSIVDYFLLFLIAYTNYLIYKLVCIKNER